MALFLPQESVLPAFFRENPDDVFGSGGRGASLCLSCGVLQSSWPGVSIDEGAVDAALNREELSVVDAVFVFDAPLPLEIYQLVSRGYPSWKSPEPSTQVELQY